MTFSNINVSNPNSGLGDKLRDAFIIVNDNFSSIGEIVTPEYISATLSNYVTLISFNNQNNVIAATISTLESDISNRALLVHTHSVSNVTGLQGQLDSKASLTQLNNAITALNDTIAELNLTISNKIDEAPLDGNTYGRKNGEWIII